MTSRNKREGKYRGKMKGLYFRHKIVADGDGAWRYIKRPKHIERLMFDLFGAKVSR